MSKVVISWPYAPKFFGRPFFRNPQIFVAKKFLGSPNFFYLFRPKDYFLDFIDLRTVF